MDTMFKYLDLLSPNQHGSVPRRSQLLNAFKDWTLSLDKHLSTDVVHFDFSKAFDSVPHTSRGVARVGHGWAFALPSNW